MDEEAVRKLIDDKVAEASSKWMKTRRWRHDRWESIKKDWQAAGIMFVAGMAAPTLYGWGQKFLGLVL